MSEVEGGGRWLARWGVGLGTGVLLWTGVEYLGRRWLSPDPAGSESIEAAEGSMSGPLDPVALAASFTYDTIGALGIAGTVEVLRRYTACDLRPLGAGLVAGSFWCSIRQWAVHAGAASAAPNSQWLDQTPPDWRHLGRSGGMGGANARAGDAAS